MYDYMKALQKRFDRQEHSELDKQDEYAQEELRRDMDAAGRGKLLRLLDAQNTLLVESKLMSFTAGFKLAWAWQKSWRQTGSTPSNGRKKNTSAIQRNRGTKMSYAPVWNYLWIVPATFFFFYQYIAYNITGYDEFIRSKEVLDFQAL